MKTKQIPAIIMLMAGLAVSIVGIISQMEAMQFLKILVIVLISFFVTGHIAKLILDKNFKEEKKDATEKAVEEEIVDESTVQEKK